MVGGRRKGLSLALPVMAVASCVLPVRANIDLEWRPAVIAAAPQDIIEIGAFAVSDTGFDQVFSGLSLLFQWDPARLELIDFVDPCPQDPCDPGTYRWIQSFFPDDSQLDGINNDITDGDAFFQVFGQLGFDASPLATPDGLQITTLRFRVLDFGATEVAFAEQIGTTRTVIAGSDIPGVDVTGVLGPPVQVLTFDCRVPMAEGTGSRYFAITPGSGGDPVALRVEGDGGNSDVSCVDQFVQADGSLGAAPFFQTPAEWGTVHVHGEAIQPSTTYSVRADCSQASPGQLVSGSTSATTWRWGDTNDDGMVAITDLTNAIDASSGVLPIGTLLDAVDVAPCVPDGLVTQEDVDAVLAALGLQPFPCAAPCLETSLTDLLGFVNCLAGPFFVQAPACSFSDFDGDGDVDALDFGVFQRRFVGPGSQSAAPGPSSLRAFRP